MSLDKSRRSRTLEVADDVADAVVCSDKLTADEMADLVAYLLTLKGCRSA